MHGVPGLVPAAQVSRKTTENVFSGVPEGAGARPCCEAAGAGRGGEPSAGTAAATEATSPGEGRKRESGGVEGDGDVTRRGPSGNR